MATPEQIREGVRRFQAELDATAPALAKVLGEFVDTCEGYGPAPELRSHVVTDDLGRTYRVYINRDGSTGYCVDLDDDGNEVCSMCGETTHTERERTDDGEWNEDCEFVPFYDGDGRDLRRPGQAGRSR